MICIGEYTVAASLATAVAGWMTPESVKTYIAINADPWDNNDQIDFEEPMGSFGIEWDIHKHARLFAEHLSSPRQCNDHPGINHAGIKFLAPVGGATLYSGISVNNSNTDSNDRFTGPLVSIGVEYGNDIKIYAEHLASVKEFEDGRTSFGFKVFFK
jgi:hypothetical protein